MSLSETSHSSHSSESVAHSFFSPNPSNPLNTSSLKTNPPLANSPAKISTDNSKLSTGPVTASDFTSSFMSAVSSSGGTGSDEFQFQSFVSKLKSRQWMATLRPASVFLAPNLFSKPRTSAEVSHRMEMNFSYFLSNYAVIILFICCVAVFTDFRFLFVLLFIGMMWAYALKTEPIVIPLGSSPYILGGKNKLFALMFITTLLLFVIAGATLLVMIGLCVLLILPHLIFHNRAGERGGSLANEDDDIELTSPEGAEGV